MISTTEPMENRAKTTTDGRISLLSDIRKDRVQGAVGKVVAADLTMPPSETERIAAMSREYQALKQKIPATAATVPGMA